MSEEEKRKFRLINFPIAVIVGTVFWFSVTSSLRWDILLIRWVF